MADKPPRVAMPRDWIDTGHLPLDDDGRLACSLPCLGCGYDLRGVMPQGICPECGSAVARSLRPMRIGRWPGHWLRHVTMALDAVIQAGWFMVFFGPICLPFMARAVFALTTPDTRDRQPIAGHTRLRTLARGAAVAACLAMLPACMGCTIASSVPSAGASLAERLIGPAMVITMLTCHAAMLVATANYCACVAVELDLSRVAMYLRRAGLVVVCAHVFAALVVVVAGLGYVRGIGVRVSFMAVVVTAYVSFGALLHQLTQFVEALREIQRDGWKLAPLRTSSDSPDDA